ncbi:MULTISPECIES: PepSY domain-containing protein [unclassified Herbaspirillum]|uniref:PepSY-associated TM helix domain-containing protein n=1 Tax=unclassified Herbaspirillum TaxID=2624150 RepID=UPI0011530AF9|nr:MULTISPECIES: PepSY-associated TM helix domain-containing protein [unclassified Herbaspirillum]MBB5391983.1 putative iron-regulated membrane protein [Herbaspirillum sp. SJZ102]TQK13443.1 putative iron-regulated membrane protein [Herbaspirillum sp. SJZ130]TQK15447.1 putative iron-regulated membrane protein [Herbaspirillum sp. SJZ106]TWC71342.1 putative iron-regulated membrane protein [Herbaspirillum sp. SJZ099]
MREGFRQSMAWLHTWSGLLVCWVLLLVFAGGAASYFKDEITFWMKPELHAGARDPVAPAVALQHAVAYLEKQAPHAERWFISLPSERSSAIRAGWIGPPSGNGAKDTPRSRFRSELLDPASGQKMAAVRETRGGEFLYRLHFDLHYMPAIWARWIVSVCAMFMLVAIISGVITHKRIFKDFFTFRPGKGQRSWLDAHNATAVLALPFHLMITYTGLVTLMFMIMPWGVQAAYRDKGGESAFFEEVFPVGAGRAKPAGVAAPLAAMAPILEQASRHWNGAPPATIVVNNPGDANATIVVTRQKTRTLSYLQPGMLFNGVSGAQVSAMGDDPSAAAVTRGALYGLHMGHFADPWLRVLFFLCGLAGCVMVASGALLWAVKTRQKQAKALAQGARRTFGLRLVDALNIGAIAGLPIAFAAYFWANRLLPVGLPQRPQMEIACFFAAWAAAAVLAQIRPTMGMWRFQLSVAAAMFIGIPILNVFTTHSHLGVTLLLGRGPWPVAGFDITVLLLGSALALAVRALGKREKKQDKAAAAGARTEPGKLKEAA